MESLRCFVAAAELLNFRAAAKRVGLTPAALGQRIRQLEELYETRLFERTTRRVSLTESGASLLPAASAALESAEQCASAARGELEAPPMALTVGTRHELGLSWLTPMLPTLARLRDNLTLHLYVGSGSDLPIRVRDQTIDCAVVSSAPQDPLLDQLLLHAEFYVLVASPKLLARQPLGRSEEAVAHCLLDINPALPLFRYWRDNEATPYLAFRSARYLGAIATIRRLVLSGDGVAVLPKYFVQADLDRGRLTPLFARKKLLSDHFRLLFRTGDRRRPVFERIAESMRSSPLK